MTTTPILRQLPMFPDLDAVLKKPENKPNLGMVQKAAKLD